MFKNFQFLLILLQPLGFLYGLIMKLRAWLYIVGFFEKTSVEAHVISVGNLTMGGSGKTPVVIYLAELLLRNGYKPAVISRGYKGNADKKCNVVSDGKEILLSTAESGDEPRLIAEAVPGLVVITGKKRKYPCTIATQEYHCDTIILDDAFQHLSVLRNVDLVLFNSTTLFRNMNVFPSGYLREPTSALQRADCFILTGYNASNIDLVDKFKTQLINSFHNKPVFKNRNIPRCFVDRNGYSYDLDFITSPVVAFCGIASPSRFQTTLNEISVEVADHKIFKDHVSYSPQSVRKLEAHAKNLGCNTLITTTKDMVKLKNINTDLKLYALKMDIEFDSSFDAYILEGILKQRSFV